MNGIDTKEWTTLFKEGLDRHRQIGHDEGCRKGYKEGYLAAVHELQIAEQTINAVADGYGRMIKSFADAAGYAQPKDND